MESETVHYFKTTEKSRAVVDERNLFRVS